VNPTSHHPLEIAVVVMRKVFALETSSSNAIMAG
jgi:hypothetical protein